MEQGDAAGPSPADPGLRRAADALAAGRPDEALRLAEPMARAGHAAGIVLAAQAHVARGQPGQAERLLRGGAARQPGELRLWEALVQFYRQRGLGAPAAECLAHAARAHAARGDLERALASLAQARKLDPGNAALIHDYGVACFHGGDAEKAETAFREVLQAEPRHDLARLNLARALERLERLDEAAALYRELIASRPDEPAPAREYAWLLRSAGEFEAAEREFRRVLERWPADPEASVGLAGLLEMRGEAAAARGLLEGLPEAARGRPDVALSQARLLRRAGEAATARDRLSAVAAAAARDPALAPRWHFEMAAALDALGEAGPAFAEATLANGMRVTGWDRNSHRAWVDRLIAASGGDAFSEEQAPGRSRAGAGTVDSAEDAPTPVFIVGMPRSGTTLAEHLLTGFGNVVACGERNDMLRHAASITGYPETLARLGAAPLAELATAYLGDAQAGVILVDKMPVNFLHLGLIARVFPNARVIHCVRDPLDTALSCYFQDFTAPFLGFANDLVDLGWYWQDYRRLMDHWRAVLPLAVFELPYESLVADPKPWVRRLGEFVGAESASVAAPDPGRFIATNSAAQVRRPVSDRAVGRHRRYLEELAPLSRLLNLSPR